MNKLSKYLILVLILIVGMLFSGCSLNTNTNENSFSIGSGSANTNSGVGIDLSFAKGNPPTEMFIDSPVNFGLVFKNYQNHDIENMKVFVSGFDKGFVSGLNSEYTVSKIPKASDIGPGEYTLLINGVKVSGFNGKSFQFNPIFKYFYTAHSTLIQAVCIPDKTNQCNLDVSNEKVQNGPVQINIDKITNLGDKIMVQFTLKNIGNGKVVTDENSINKDEYMSKYKVDYVKLGTNEGTCKPQGTEDYVIVNGVGHFYCDFSNNVNEAYTSQISAQVTYNYLQQNQIKINVQNLASQ
jgi:hypothetical protein